MRKRALIVAKRSNLINSPSGGNRRIADIAQWLVSQGFEVEVIDNLSEIGKSYDLITIVSFAAVNGIAHLRKKCDILWIDLTDSWKLTRRNLLTSNPLGQSLRFIRDSIMLDEKRLRVADIISYCNRRDALFDALNLSNVLIFNHQVQNQEASTNHGKRYVFVGDDKYTPNKEAIRFLLKIRSERVLDAPLVIYGNRNSTLNNQFDEVFQGVQNNNQLYGKLDVHLVPLWRGAGVKYKTLDPLSRGLIVISTVEGANGFLPNQNLIIARSMEEFVHHMINAFKIAPSRTTACERSAIFEEDDRIRIAEILSCL